MQNGLYNRQKEICLVLRQPMRCQLMRPSCLVVVGGICGLDCRHMVTHLKKNISTYLVSEEFWALITFTYSNDL